MNQYRTATIPIFTIGEMKRMAKKQLSGKWLRLLPLMLIYTLLTTVPAVVIQLNSYMTQTSQLNSMLASEGSATSEMISDMLTSMQTSPAAGMTTFGLIASALALYTFLTAGAFSVSLSGLSLRILRNEPFSVRTIFAGFTQYGKAFIANLLVSILRTLGSSLHSSGQLLSGNGYRFRQPDSRLLILHGIYRAFVSGCHFSHALPDDFLHRGR